MKDIGEQNQSHLSSGPSPHHPSPPTPTPCYHSSPTTSISHLDSASSVRVPTAVSVVLSKHRSDPAASSNPPPLPSHSRSTLSPGHGLLPEVLSHPLLDLPLQPTGLLSHSCPRAFALTVWDALSQRFLPCFIQTSAQMLVLSALLQVAPVLLSLRSFASWHHHQRTSSLGSILSLAHRAGQSELPTVPCPQSHG